VWQSTVKGRQAGFDMPLHPQAVTALHEHLDTLADQSPTGFVIPGRQPGTRLSKTPGWRATKRVLSWTGIMGAPMEIGLYTLSAKRSPD
jgi:hypothetical protein